MSFIKSLTQFKSDFEQPFISKNTSIDEVCFLFHLVHNYETNKMFNTSSIHLMYYTLRQNWLKNKRLATLRSPRASRHKAGSVSTDVTADDHVTRTDWGIICSI